MPRAPRTATPKRNKSMRRAVRQDDRPSASSRGYNSQWRKVRAEVLRAYGIPRDLWSLYDVDHRPPYNPTVEPDHRKYELVPMLHADHSRKTATEDGAFGHRRRASFFQKESNETECAKVSQTVPGFSERGFCDG